MRKPVALVVAFVALACARSRDDAAVSSQRDETPAAVRELGSWSGRGNTTLGFVSESGSFRITWKAQNHDNQHPGTLLLTLRSGISGRPMTVIADHQGAGGGSVEFGDDPRMYEFLVESSRLDWSISVQETFAPRGSTSPHR
jgi:outer membrane biogenesis lipoprotein LolB